MAKRKKLARKPEKTLDIIYGKRGRGRPGVRRSEIRGRGDHYRILFGQVWNGFRKALLKARTEEEVVRAFDLSPSYMQEFTSIAALILKVLREPKFPKRRQSQINFLADSLAGRGRISPRRSRDICEQERNKKERHIIRREYYIECTCGYKGPALDGGCRKCGTGKSSLPHLAFDWQ